MRAFIAIPIPGPCLETIARIQHGLRESAADVRWTAISSIHLTLKFLGEVDPAIIPELAESLRVVSHGMQAFNLRLSGLGSFPNQKNPRTIWCGILGDTEALSNLQQGIETACMKSGFAPEDRPFRPHLTLGRLKGKRNLDSLADRIKAGSDLECGFSADHFNIYKSVLKPQGAVYTVLETVQLNM